MTNTKTNYLKIYDDNPTDTAKQFDFNAYAKTLTEIIIHKENETPITIAIHGEWGSGKTSLMKTMKKNLENYSEDENTRKCKCIWFNAWKYADEESMLTALINSILEQVKKDKKGQNLIENLNEKIKEVKKIKSFSLSAFGTGVGVEMKPEESLSYDIFQKSLNNILEEYITGKSNDKGNIDDTKGVLVIFIDDIDRCQPDKVLKVLESIKLFLDQKGCIFVVGADMNMISNIISNAYKDIEGFDGRRFMEKIVQLRFNLLPIRDIEIEKYIESLDVTTMIKDYIKIISKGIRSNPRQIKRFLNLFELQKSLTNNKGILGKGKLLDEELLAKWCILELEFPSLIEEVKKNHGFLISIQEVARSEDKKKEIESLDDKEKELHKKFQDARIFDVLKHGQKEFTKDSIINYIYQTQEVTLKREEGLSAMKIEDIMKKIEKIASLTEKLKEK